jgi:hypothetical protein
MKYALLIYTPTSADDYASAEAAARTSTGGAWVDYTKATRTPASSSPPSSSPTPTPRRACGFATGNG